VPWGFEKVAVQLLHFLFPKHPTGCFKFCYCCSVQLRYIYTMDAPKFLSASLMVRTMMLNFKRNIHFTRLVKVADRLREFNFRKLPGTETPCFHIDVPDDRGNRIVFRMQQENNNWKIVDQQLPPWINATETKLNEVIEEELR
jgi:hypothetical protein